MNVPLPPPPGWGGLLATQLVCRLAGNPRLPAAALARMLVLLLAVDAAGAV